MLKQETQADQPIESDKTDISSDISVEEKCEEVPQNEQVNPAEPDGKAQEADAPDRITELETQLAEARDQLLRKAAEFENFRKRMNQEKQSSIEYANQSLLSDIITIIDDFERAIQAGENGSDYNGFLEGIKMIEKRFTGQLESKWGLKRFNSAGELFDPNFHEAVSMEKSADVSEATVQEDFMKGYMLKERVLRAAKVKVIMPEG